jgi:hypothetical protein
MLKRSVIFGLAFGAGFAAVGILVLLIANWYGSRPKAWDTKSITCVSSTANQIFSPSGTGDMVPGFHFKFVLANDSDRDYTLPKDMKLFKRSAEGKALGDIGFNTRIAHAVLIPAKERAELDVIVDFGCYIHDAGHETLDDPEKCFQSFLTDSVGYVALDDVNRIRIDLPKPSWQGPKGRPEARKEPPSKMLPPNKGTWFDQVDACDEATRLVNLCKQKGIRPTEHSFAALGGYADNLKSLPIPPGGFQLHASQETCDTVYEWNNYCQDHKLSRGVVPPRLLPVGCANQSVFRARPTSNSGAGVLLLHGQRAVATGQHSSRASAFGRGPF